MRTTIFIFLLFLASFASAQTAKDTADLKIALKGCETTNLAKYTDYTGTKHRVYLTEDKEVVFYVRWDADKRRWSFIDCYTGQNLVYAQ